MSTTTKSAIQTASLYSLEKIRELVASSTTRDTLQAADGRAVAVDASSVNRSVAQIDQLSRLAYTRAAPSTDSRYVKFVEAVRALRVDLDLSSLSRAQIDRILESAARMYLVNDGIPEPVEPLSVEPPADLHRPVAGDRWDQEVAEPAAPGGARPEMASPATGPAADRNNRYPDGLDSNPTAAAPDTDGQDLSPPARSESAAAGAEESTRNARIDDARPDLDATPPPRDGGDGDGDGDGEA